MEPSWHTKGLKQALLAERREAGQGSRGVLARTILSTTTPCSRKRSTRRHLLCIARIIDCALHPIDIHFAHHSLQTYAPCSCTDCATPSPVQPACPSPTSSIRKWAAQPRLLHTTKARDQLARPNPNPSPTNANTRTEIAVALTRHILIRLFRPPALFPSSSSHYVLQAPLVPRQQLR